MKWNHIILYCLLLASCAKKENITLTQFTDQKINQWEMATTDSIINLINRNKDNNIDSLELRSLHFYYNQLYNHNARIVFIDQIRNDTAIANAQFKEFAM